MFYDILYESSQKWCRLSHYFTGSENKNSSAVKPRKEELRATFITCPSGELQFGQKPDMQLKCTNTKIHIQSVTLVNSDPIKSLILDD